MSISKFSKRSSLMYVLASAAIVLTPSLAGAQIAVGAVEAQEPAASRQQAGAEPIALSVSDKVFMRDIVKTSIGGKVQVKFIDGSDLRLNSGSQVSIDEYVYQPDSGKGARAVISVGGGVLRFVSGKTEKDGVTFKTPTATMGIRGTDIVIRVDVTGASRVDVISGTVTLYPCGRSAGSDPYVAEAGTALIVDTNCGVSAAAANSDAGAPGAAGAAGPGAAGPGAGPGGSAGVGGPGNGNGNSGNSGNGGGNTGGSGPGSGNGGGNGNGNGNGGAGSGGAGAGGGGGASL